jgi:hypothetical protein
MVGVASLRLFSFVPYRYPQPKMAERSEALN